MLMELSEDSLSLYLEQPLPAAFRSLDFMATAQHPAAPPTLHRGVAPLRAGQGNSFIWRKFHSLLGIIPIGAFLLEHLLSNFEALKGPIAYGEQVRFLNSLPMVRVLEWVFIFLPILYHAIYGV